MRTTTQQTRKRDSFKAAADLSTPRRTGTTGLAQFRDNRSCPDGTPARESMGNGHLRHTSLLKKIVQCSPSAGSTSVIQRSITVGGAEYDVDGVVGLLRADSNVVWHDEYIDLLQEFNSDDAVFSDLIDLLMRMAGIIVASHSREERQDTVGVEDEVTELDEEELPTFHHFKSGQELDLSFTDLGEIQDTEESRKASTSKRRGIFRSAGIGEHILKGHFLDETTLKSQATAAKGNFSWTSDRAFFTAMEEARSSFQPGAKVVEVDTPAGDGVGFVYGTDQKLYRVEPKRARFVRKPRGDFKTAYGLTEEKDPSSFDDAYHTFTVVHEDE